MILKGFKKKTFEKYLDKLLSKSNSSNTSKKIESLAVIVNLDEVNDYQFFTELANLLDVKLKILNIISFTSNIKSEAVEKDDCFTPKDFTWNGRISNKSLQEFLNTPFDALVSFYSQDIIHLKLLTAISKAHFKIGLIDDDERINNLIIKTKARDYKTFKFELKKYLTILKKI